MLALITLWLAAATAPPSILVLDTQLKGAPPALGSVMTSELVSRIASQGHKVISRQDVADLLSLEESKQLLGCDDGACLSQIGARLNADRVLTSTLGSVGGSLVLSLALIEGSTARVLERASVTGTDAAQLTDNLGPGLAQLFAWEGAAGLSFQMPDGAKLSFAVFDLDAQGVEAELAANLTQILSVEVKKVEGTSVISRDDIVAMLQLDAAKMELGCDADASCIAEIGGALGVDKLIAGSVGKLDDSYVLTLRLIDAAAVRVDNRVTETFSGDAVQLIRAVRHAGRRLLGIQADVAGALAVTADQPGAAVFVDSEAAGALPLPPLTELSPGRHLVRLSKDGFFDYQTEIYVDPGETTVLWGSLQERPEKWYQKWWVWTVVGVAVAGGVTAAVIATQPQPTTAPGRVTIQ